MAEQQIHIFSFSFPYHSQTTTIDPADQLFAYKIALHRSDPIYN